MNLISVNQNLKAIHNSEVRKERKQYMNLISVNQNLKAIHNKLMKEFIESLHESNISKSKFESNPQQDMLYMLIETA